MYVTDNPNSDATRDLEQLLQSLPPGQVPDDLGIDRLLAACWDGLDGSDDGGMEASKLIERMEQVGWKSPLLTFMIERHGGTVCGSTRGELQHWTVNLDEHTAEITKTGHRQLEPMAKRISVKPMAAEIAERILNGDEDDRLQWLDDGSVKVRAYLIFPTGSGYKRTVQDRRQRLCDYICKVLMEHGWKKLGWNRFGR